MHQAMDGEEVGEGETTDPVAVELLRHELHMARAEVAQLHNYDATARALRDEVRSGVPFASTYSRSTQVKTLTPIC